MNARGGGVVTWDNFCWVCAAGLWEPLPHYIVCSVAYPRPHASYLLLGKSVVFAIPTQSPSIYVSTLLKIGHPKMTPRRRIFRCPLKETRSQQCIFKDLNILTFQCVYVNYEMPILFVFLVIKMFIPSRLSW